MLAQQHASRSTRAFPFVIAGPALVGAALGLPGGPLRVATHALTLPAIVVGVALLMLPALYIGAALFGVAPRAQVMVRSALAALIDTGIVFLGFAAPLLFLVAASTGFATVSALGVLVVGAGIVLGLRALYMRLFDQRSRRALLLFILWALVAAGIGGQLFVETILVASV